MKKPLYVIFSLDVEEEGLFSGSYKGRGATCANVALLPRLLPLSGDYGLPLTLFCSHAVFMDKEARDSLALMRDKAGAEIAAHLHHWSTPPYGGEESPPRRTHLLEPELLRQRLQNLLKAGAQFNGEPLVSFRMGRWDLKKALFPLLLEQGIKTDCSICPLRVFAGGADHFLAPADPYWAGKAGSILEIPITQIPLFPWLPRLWRRLGRPALLDQFHFFGALSANPLWHGDLIMRLATRLHSARGGRVLSIFLHSSELMPGGSPHVPDAAAADRVLKRIFAFCRWLADNFQVRGLTARALRELAPDADFPRLNSGAAGDW